jgi:hypothetical protein
MRKVLIVLGIAAVAAATTGCSKTAKGIADDTHKNIEWVGDRF